LIGQFTTIIKWLTANGPMITQRIVAVFESVELIIEKVKPSITWVLDKFKNLDEATGGFSTKVLLLTGVLSKMGLPPVVAAIAALALNFDELGNSFERMTTGAKVIGTIAIAIGAISGSIASLIGLGAAAGAWFDKLFPRNCLARMGESLGGALFQSSHKDEDAIRTLMNSGLTQPQAIGVTANLKQESGLDPFRYGDSFKAYGIGQWHEDRRADYEKMFGHSMDSVSDYDQAYQEQFAF
jgi:hypothetical protein